MKRETRGGEEGGRGDAGSRDAGKGEWAMRRMGDEAKGEREMLPSKRSAEEIAQFFSEAAAQHKLSVVTQHNLILAVEPRLQLADSFDVDDCRSMNPRKASRIELRFESPDRLSQKVRGFADVKSDVLPFG